VSGKVILKKKPASRASTYATPPVETIIVTCPGGAERVLAGEMERLGAVETTIENGAVRGKGGEDLIPVLNEQLRTGSRVLLPLKRFDVETYDDVYEAAREIPWHTYLHPEDTFVIDGVSRSDTLRDHRFLAMRLKDAIVDEQREHFNGRRSSVSKEGADLIVRITAIDRTVEIAIDSTGDPLHLRGYRTEAGEAPVRETVAAMMLLDAEFRRDDPRVFLDPFCGSGTIVIEAALISSGRGPGTLGREFAWRRWPWNRSGTRAPADHHDNPRRQTTRGAVSARGVDTITGNAPRRGGGLRIVGTDSDPDVIEIARRNAKRAGVSDLVEFFVADVRKSIAENAGRGARYGGSAGLIVTNPPYGVRLQPEELSSLYSDLGTALRDASGWTAIVLAAETAPVREIGLSAATRRRVFNGALPCRAYRYEIFGRRERQGRERDRR